jgi:regulator of RNase E activity RraA
MIDPALLARLNAPLLSDSLDACGARHQALPPRIRPLDEDLVMFGRARTGLYMEVAHVEPGHNPYELEMRLVDDLKPGEVVVLAVGGSLRIAPWGGLLTTASKARGAAGCLTDGYVRDVRQIRARSFPVFHAGIGPLDSQGRGEIRAIDVPCTVAGVLVAPGDLVFGDIDGVVVIPRALEEAVLAAAADKLSREDSTMAELERGAKLAEVYARFGVL